MNAKLVALLLAALAFSASADDRPGDDTLRYYLSRSHAAVSGEVTDMICFSSDSTGCAFRLRVEHVFKGEVRIGDLLPVQTEMFWTGGYELPCSTDHAKCIVFLRPPDENKEWRVADPWFGMHDDSAFLAGSLRRVSAD